MIRRVALVLALLAGLAATGLAAPALRDLPPAVFGGRAAVTDGDTIRVEGIRVRLAVIDAPERAQVCDLRGKPWACGDAAAETLAALVADRPVTCRHGGRSSHNRVVAVCEAAGVNLSLAMVERGMAFVGQRYLREWPALAPAFRRAEAEAKAARRGLWGAQVQTPAAARRAARSGES